MTPTTERISRIFIRFIIIADSFTRDDAIDCRRQSLYRRLLPYAFDLPARAPVNTGTGVLRVSMGILTLFSAANADIY